MARVGLDRDQIVAAALDLVDEVGLDRMSTRTLATRLGVQSPALYWHFRSKEDLVAAMAEAMQLDLPDAERDRQALGARPSRATVAQWLTERAERFRRVLLSRRDGARIHAGSRPPLSRWAGVEAQLEVLHVIGFEPSDAARITVAISRFVVGWVLEEQSETATSEAPPADDAYPLVTKALAARHDHDPDADFTASATAVVNGLVRRR